MSLLELQHDFIHALFDRQQQETAAAWVQTQGSLDAAQRVGIYRHSVHGILWQYLRSLYPVCQHLVGNAFFEQVCDQYIDQFPPTRPFLAEYGDGFAAFLHQHPSLTALRWIAEVARLEWARQQAWNAVNQAAADFSRLAWLDEEQQASLRLQLPASAQWLESDYAIHAIWLAHQPEESAEKLPLEQINLHQPSAILVWRQGRSLRQTCVGETERQFLQAVLHAATLPELAERFQGALPGLLTNSVQRGWILSFSTAPQVSRP